jgi:putative lipoprotein
MTRWIMWIAVACLLSLSCSPDAPNRRGESAAVGGDLTTLSDLNYSVRLYRGFAVHGHEVRSFVPCGSDEGLWVIEHSGLLWVLHKELTRGQEPYQRMFVQVEGREVSPPTEGFGAEYPAALKIEKVLYAGVEGPGCSDDWGSFHYRAHGNEPFWSVEASSQRIRLSRMGSGDLLWQNVTWQRTDGSLRYAAIDSAMTSVELMITPESCRDSMSGSYYAFAAVLRVGDEELHGCTLQGLDGPTTTANNRPHLKRETQPF